MKYTFGDIVVVDEKNIGVVVKTWVNQYEHASYEVYVRLYNGIKTYEEDDIESYLVRHKYLDEEELEYQYNAVHSL